jgi:hypothetical protein
MAEARTQNMFRCRPAGRSDLIGRAADLATERENEGDGAMEAMGPARCVAWKNLACIVPLTSPVCSAALRRRRRAVHPFFLLDPEIRNRKEKSGTSPGQPSPEEYFQIP